MALRLTPIRRPATGQQASGGYRMASHPATTTATCSPAVASLSGAGRNAASGNSGRNVLTQCAVVGAGMLRLPILRAHSFRLRSDRIDPAG